MPHALLVDDSRTARAVLKHMLSKESYEVEAVESAEQGLEYLKEGSTDVIFMDHMMPGMDGFQAVKRLKASETTRHIPIVMYTSKDGDVYRGQATALGAASILSKPATQAQLQQVLKEVAASVVNASRAEARAEQKVTVGKTNGAAVADAGASSEVATPKANDERKRTETETEKTVEEPSSAADAPKSSTPVPAVVLTTTDNDNAKASEPITETPARKSHWLMPWLLILGVLAAIMAGAKYSEVRQAFDEASRANKQLLSLLVDVANRAGRVEPGELGFAGTRVDLLRSVLEAADAAGFQGTVVIKAHAGQFCMSQSPSGELYVAEDQLPIGECVSVGMNERAAVRQTEALSSRFRELLDVHPALDKRSLSVRAEGAGDAEPLLSYPSANAVRTAGDWNSVARVNNRVEFQLIPLQRQ